MMRLIKFKGLKELKEDDGAALITCTIASTVFEWGVYYFCPMFAMTCDSITEVLGQFFGGMGGR